MLLNMVQPFTAIQKLIHSHPGWQSRVRETQGTVSSGGKSATIHRRIAIDQKRVQISQTILAVVVPGFGTKTPLIIEKAELGKVIDVAAVPLVACVSMSPVIGSGWIVKAGLGVILPANSTFLVPSRAGTPFQNAFDIAPSCREGRPDPWGCVVGRLEID
jgi:hypothetical protein